MTKGREAYDKAVQSGFDPLLLNNQICFPLYAAAKEVVHAYIPLLEELDLTYTQYIAMMVLWEEKCVSVTHLGERLFLDSGTLTPLLKKLEAKGLVKRERSKEDERRLDVSVTDEGMALREKALSVPVAIGSCVNLEVEEAIELKRLLAKVMENLQGSEARK